ncbi:hypothetical protein MN116_002577 [Schistosoma mekongi]|uniref:Uncharacterized protein n=1 Tax=Schistosoma mekongi TaxID=38744 RepID=A0AAE1ZFH5_SCHME|nr:hypothetical protein MN116_002577 [Schistosoma mekongi]
MMSEFKKEQILEVSNTANEYYCYLSNITRKTYTSHLIYSGANPCLVKDADTLEQIQRVSTKSVAAISGLPYQKRIKRLNIACLVLG